MACGGLWRNRTERYDPLVPAPLPTLSIDTTLLKPGLRVAVGLSGGADSVALLRILAERSRELGLVLHAAHLHHGLRGAEADADRDFSRELAQRLGLLFHEAQVDTAAAALADAWAGKAAETIEEAARRLRYGWFRELMASGVVDAVATAHTLDDQAETVLGKFLRGAWTEGLSGIYPVMQYPEGPILRPLLATTRSEIEAYLGGIGQNWREDSSNRHLTFTRNRIRHELLPLLESWNPRLRTHLAQMAELARDEESWWAAELERLASQIVLPGRPVRGGGRGASDGLAIEVDRLAELAPALQRRILRLAAGRLGASPDFESTESLRKLALTGRAGQKCELAPGLRGERTHRELRLSVGSGVDSTLDGAPAIKFEIPGEIEAPAWGIRVRVVFAAGSGITENETVRQAVLRSWKPGDRVRLRHSGGPRKVKEVLERLRVFGSARTHWPVLELDGRVIWMQGVELEPEPGIEIRVAVLDVGSEAAGG
jgi:tRNA(Ile)-lysidine synthase